MYTTMIFNPIRRITTYGHAVPGQYRQPKELD